MSNNTTQTRIRNVKPEDLDAVILMTENRRLQYQEYQPVFWRKAENSAQKALAFMEQLMSRGDTVFLVSERNGRVNGFLLATEIKAPPVYDPQGATFQIVDFCVLTPDLWEDSGRLLLSEARSILKQKGAAQIVVVCGDRDLPKAAMLRGEDLSIASS